jgi:hypothetical protein
MKLALALFILIELYCGTSDAETLFVESFEDSRLHLRGWYDDVRSATIDRGGYRGNCLAWKWNPGDTTPTTAGIMRKVFKASDELYIKFYVKFGSSWRGSRESCGHLVMIFCNLDSEYANPNWSYLNTYFEFVSDNQSPYKIRPVFQIQDSRRINVSACEQGRPPCDLTRITENRSVSGCNGTVGDPAPHGGRCYFDGKNWLNERRWVLGNTHVDKEAWIKIEAYLKMNTASRGKGQANGDIAMWVNDLPVLNMHNVLFRTNRDADKKWAQLALAPYIGDGAQSQQMIWIDELEVSHKRP